MCLVEFRIDHSCFGNGGESEGDRGLLSVVEGVYTMVESEVDSMSLIPTVSIVSRIGIDCTSLDDGVSMMP